MDEPPITPDPQEARARRSASAPSWCKEGRAQAHGHRRQHRRGDDRGQDGDRHHRRRRPARRSPPCCRRQSGCTVVLDVGANVDTKPEHLRAVRGDGPLLRAGGPAAPRRRASACSRSARRRARAPTSPARCSRCSRSRRPQLRRQRRGARRLQRHGRRHRLRRLRRQRGAQVRRGAGRDDRAHAARGDAAARWRTKLGYLFAKPAFERFRNRTDYAEYGAAPLLGVNGGCFIGHGGSNAKAVQNAILPRRRVLRGRAPPEDPREDRRAARLEERLEAAAPAGGGLSSPGAAIAFVFPGQGSQKVGMGNAWADEFAEARAGLRGGRRRARLPAVAPLLGGAGGGAAAHRQHAAGAPRHVDRRLPRARGSRACAPDVVAGHSLGEYSALVAAGALDLRRRAAPGAAARRADAGGGAGGRRAPWRRSSASTPSLVREMRGRRPPAIEVCAVANLNAPGQTVIAGHRAAVERAVALAKERGARKATLLPVSAPFHSPLMASGARRHGAAARRGAVPRPAGAGGVQRRRARRSTRRRRRATRWCARSTSPVRWVESVECMAQRARRRELRRGRARAACSPA